MKCKYILFYSIKQLQDICVFSAYCVCISESFKHSVTWSEKYDEAEGPFESV